MATMNPYDALEDDELDECGDYISPWKLDCAAIGNFAGKHIRIRKRVQNGFDVMVANGDKITQQQEGIVPFNVPTAAAKVAVFKKCLMHYLQLAPLSKLDATLSLARHKQKYMARTHGTTSTKVSGQARSNYNGTYACEEIGSPKYETKNSEIANRHRQEGQGGRWTTGTTRTSSTQCIERLEWICRSTRSGLYSLKRI